MQSFAGTELSAHIQIPGDRREPNFVTDETVTADVIELDGESEGHGLDSEHVNLDSEGYGLDSEGYGLDGKLVLIPQADPGYDWLFGHDIAGLITKYGGSNSHMAVRAAEFSLSAAIGVGENRYDQLRRADVIECNCDGRYLDVLR